MHDNILETFASGKDNLSDVCWVIFDVLSVCNRHAQLIYIDIGRRVSTVIYWGVTAAEAASKSMYLLQLRIELHSHKILSFDADFKACLNCVVRERP